MRQALKAVASLTNVNIKQAATTVRKQPLLNEEIHIEEELINLEEAIKHYHIAAPTLKQYPDMRRHTLKERRDILVHCVGLIARMMGRQKLPRSYSKDDTEHAVRKLVQLIIHDAQKVGYEIPRKQLEAMRPYMNWRQGFAYREWTFNPVDHAADLFRRLVTAR